MCGTVYFLDGHTEDIIRYRYLRNDDYPVIEFHTATNTYIYRQDQIETLERHRYLRTCVKTLTYKFLLVQFELRDGLIDFRRYDAAIERLELKE